MPSSSTVGCRHTKAPISCPCDVTFQGDDRAKTIQTYGLNVYELQPAGVERQFSGAGVAILDNDSGAENLTFRNTSQDRPYEFVFLDCKLTSDRNSWIGPDGLPANQHKHPMADLGCPRLPCGSVAYINCWIGDDNRPAGWGQLETYR